jgi:hypothetical protein
LFISPISEATVEYGQVEHAVAALDLNGAELRGAILSVVMASHRSKIHMQGAASMEGNAASRSDDGKSADALGSLLSAEFPGSP